MSSSTDILGLNKTKMFEKIRAGLPAERSKTHNLLECKDHLLFAWDSADCVLLVVNWFLANELGEVKFQTLIPSTPQNFQVEKILVSPEGSLIALAGPRGLAILELPRRWGSNGLFMEGKERITCRSANLNEHFFLNNSHLELLQIRWHPSSPTDSHLLALLSDNSIRVYDDSKLKHVWRVGPLPSSQRGLLHSFGDTAVDFDIAPPRVVAPSNASFAVGGVPVPDASSIQNQTVNKSAMATTTASAAQEPSKQKQKVEWPIVIIRGNGNVYVLCAGIDTEKPRLQGPLTMLPQTDDNYGLDSCSILVIPSLPPTIVMAESTGKLHHALLLETDAAEESFDEIDSTLIIHPSEWTLNVLETVELELGLPDTKGSKSHTCPIHLQRDYINELRYFAYHNTGLHVITVNFIRELQQFAETKVESNMPSFLQPSCAEYILCTKIENSNKTNAVLGFVLHQMPSGVVLLLSSGQVISLKLIIDTKLLADWSLSTDLTPAPNGSSQAQIESIMAMPFVQHIQNIFKRSVTQPILSLDKSAQPTSKESYELITQAMEVLRSQYLNKHEEARVEILKRIGLQKKFKEQQAADIQDLEESREVIRENAYRLAERYEEISEKQQLLAKKCQELVRQANSSLPNNALDFKEFQENVQRVNKATKAMAAALQKSREAMAKQDYHIQKYTETTKNRKVELPPTQEKALMEILCKLTTEIQDQIKEYKQLQAILN